MIPADLHLSRAQAWAAVHVRDGFTCCKCGLQDFDDDLHYPHEVDHILPRFLGGTDDLWNLQVLCRGCHLDKTRTERREAIARKRASTDYPHAVLRIQMQQGLLLDLETALMEWRLQGNEGAMADFLKAALIAWRAAPHPDDLR